MQPLVAVLKGLGYRATTGENTVGRADDCDITLADPSVSDHHALLTVLPGGKAVLFKDLDSTNKTGYQEPAGDQSWNIIKVTHCICTRIWLLCLLVLT